MLLSHKGRTQGASIVVTIGATEDAASRRSSVAWAARRLFRQALLRRRAALREALAGTDHHEPLEVLARNRRGRDIRCRIRLSPLLADGGPPRGVILLMESIEG